VLFLPESEGLRPAGRFDAAPLDNKRAHAYSHCEPGSDVGRLLLYNVPAVATLREAEFCLATNEKFV